MGQMPESDGTPAVLSCDSAAVAGKTWLGRLRAPLHEAFAGRRKAKRTIECQRRKSLIRSLQKHHASALEAARTDARCDRVVSGGGSTFCIEEPIMPAHSRRPSELPLT
jgi:hypothetical protein